VSDLSKQNCIQAEWISF